MVQLLLMDNKVVKSKLFDILKEPRGYRRIQTRSNTEIGVNWTYIRRSEDTQDVFWTSYVR